MGAGVVFRRIGGRIVPIMQKGAAVARGAAQDVSKVGTFAKLSMQKGGASSTWSRFGQVADKAAKRSLNDMSMSNVMQNSARTLGAKAVHAPTGLRASAENTVRHLQQSAGMYFNRGVRNMNRHEALLGKMTKTKADYKAGQRGAMIAGGGLAAVVGLPLGVKLGGSTGSTKHSPNGPKMPHTKMEPIGVFPGALAVGSLGLLVGADRGKLALGGAAGAAIGAALGQMIKFKKLRPGQSNKSGALEAARDYNK